MKDKLIRNILPILCIIISLSGFIMHHKTKEHIGPSNHQGKNLYMREGGYYYDEFLSPVYTYLKEGKLADKYKGCPQNIHPPLFTIISAYFVYIAEYIGFSKTEAFSNLLIVSNLIYLLFLFASYLLLKLIIIKNENIYSKIFFVLFFAIIAFNPRVYIQGLDFGNDMLTNSFIIISIASFLYYLKKTTTNKHKINWQILFTAMALGLASITKHFGFIFIFFICFFHILFLIVPYIKKDKRFFFLRVAELIIMISAICIISGWEYYSNIKKYNTLLPSHQNKTNKSTNIDFFLGNIKNKFKKWDFRFNVAEFISHSYKDDFQKDDKVNEQPAYRDIPLATYGLFWDDFGFYSKKNLSVYYKYAPKDIPPLLRIMPFCFSLFFIPFAFFALYQGIKNYDATIIMIAIAIFYLWSAVVYRAVIIGDDIGLKSKYMLSILPFYICIVFYGINQALEKIHQKHKTKIFYSIFVFLFFFTVLLINYDYFFSFTTQYMPITKEYIMRPFNN